MDVPAITVSAGWGSCCASRAASRCPATDLAAPLGAHGVENPVLVRRACWWIAAAAGQDGPARRGRPAAHADGIEARAPRRSAAWYACPSRMKGLLMTNGIRDSSPSAATGGRGSRRCVPPTASRCLLLAAELLRECQRLLYWPTRCSSTTSASATCAALSGSRPVRGRAAGSDAIRIRATRGEAYCY